MPLGERFNMSLYATTRLEDLIGIRDKIDNLVDRVERGDKTHLVRFFCDTENKGLLNLYEEELTLEQRDRLIDVLGSVFRGMKE